MIRRRRFKRKTYWQDGVNFVTPTADRVPTVVLAVGTAGTRGTIFELLGTQTFGNLGTVGGEGYKVHRVVGDCRLSAITDTTGSTSRADVFIREAIMWVQYENGVFLVTPDLFDAATIQSEDVLYMREQYLGPADTSGGVARPNIRNQWFQEGGFSRWNVKSRRAFGIDDALVYLTQTRNGAILANDLFVHSGYLRALITKGK